MLTYLALFAARVAGFCIRTLSLGAGSTWPGHLALKIDPRVVLHICQKKHIQTILVAGTNGKSTTASMIRCQLEALGHTVVYNEEGANLLNGIASSLIRAYATLHKKHPIYAVFETDENALPRIMDQTKPVVLVLLNVFRDQLDRYGEVNTIATRWKRVIEKHPRTHIVANAHDPLVNSLVHRHMHVTRFGVHVDEMKRTSLGHDVDSVHCPLCRHLLTYTNIAYSHIGVYRCESCGFEPSKTLTFKEENFAQYPLLGLYNIYNTHAALVAVSQITHKAPRKLHALLMTHFTAMFGRQEIVIYKNRRIMIILSKNPAGFNESWNAVAELANNNKVGLMLLLNDNIPDERDVSWIWDTDMSQLENIHTLVVGGQRAYDMAIRVAYEQISIPKIQNHDTYYQLNEHIFATTDLAQALELFIKKSPQNAQLCILPTYSAMLDICARIVGDKFKTV